MRVRPEPAFAARLKRLASAADSTIISIGDVPAPGDA
jgi:hypothetical protein